MQRDQLRSDIDSYCVHHTLHHKPHLQALRAFMTSPVIISCALTGGGDTTSTNPHVPVTPEQIAKYDVLRGYAGTSDQHQHGRH